MAMLKKALPHLIVVLSLCFLVFLVLEQFNPMMNFLKNGISEAMLALLCVSGIAHALLCWRDAGRVSEKRSEQP